METTDRNDPGIEVIKPNGQQAAYLILSDEEIAKGFIRPVRRTYRHRACVSTTTISTKIAETYARDPRFYTGTFCCHCQQHFPLYEPEEADGQGRYNFEWTTDGLPVGS